MKQFDQKELEVEAARIRSHIINTIITNGEGHAGGALSCADAMAVLFGAAMNFQPENPLDSDKFLLSAGHKCLALYGALVEAGVISEETLKTYNQLDTVLPGHPDMTKLKGVSFSTGSLGHGLPLGCGYALAAKMDKKPLKTFVLMGDGEQGEGSNWEAAAFAVMQKLDNLVAIIDENGLQINGRTCDISKPTPFEDRYAAFGWSVRTVNGHDVKALYDAFADAPFEACKPTLIVMKTTKGKGLSFLEDDVRCHHWNPKEDEKKMALHDLEIIAGGAAK
jgi:transketolase